MIKEIEATKIEMKPGEALCVTIKSDGLSMADLEMVRNGFKQKFPKNEILVMSVAPTDGVEYTVVSGERAAEIISEAEKTE